MAVFTYRLAADVSRRQRAMRRLADSHGARIDDDLDDLWQDILRLIWNGGRRSWTSVFRDALSMFHHVQAITSNSLRHAFGDVWAVSRQQAAADLLGALPMERRAAIMARRLGRHAIYDPTARNDNLFLSMILPPPERSAIDVMIDRLVRPYDEQAVGDKVKRLPHDLATQLANGMAQGKTQREVAADMLPYMEGSRVRARRAARTFGMYVAHQAQMDCHEQLGDMIAGYEIHSTKGNPHSRKWHLDRDGTIYYRQPKLGQKGFYQMPRPPMEAADPRERPLGTPQVAFGCLCWLVPRFAD